MAIGIIGLKCGMTRLFTDDGEALQVTAIKVEKNCVTQIKNEEKDGYFAVQVSTGKKKLSRTNKATMGHFAKAKVEPCSVLREFTADKDIVMSFNLGDEIKADIFQPGQMVDVVGISKGKGFAGAVKRHNFRTQDATHGNSRSHRAPGSIGQNQSPGRVFKGKKMAGHMGNVQKTIQSLEVVRIDVNTGVILIKGSVPGATGGLIVITPAVKFINKLKKFKEVADNAN